MAEYNNYNSSHTKSTNEIIKRASELSHELAYHLSWRIDKLVGFSWAEDYKYVIFLTPKFNSRYFPVPEGFKLGKIVVHAHNKTKCKVEVNFVAEDPTITANQKHMIGSMVRHAMTDSEHTITVDTEKLIDEIVEGLKNHGR